MSDDRSSKRRRDAAPREVASARLPEELVELDAIALDPRGPWDGLLVRGASNMDAMTADDLTGLDVSGCRFEGFEAVGLEVERLTLTDAVFERCDLSGSLLRMSQLRRVEFRDCRMSGVVFADSVWRDVRLVGCKLDGAHLRSLDAERVEFERCLLRDADLTAARLRASALLRSDLEGVRFAGVAAAGLRLHGSDLASIRDADALRNAVIDEAQIVPIAGALLDALAIRVERDAQAEP
jgi:uncharacterized protein YjbI with pentapeptide repeats